MLLRKVYFAALAMMVLFCGWGKADAEISTGQDNSQEKAKNEGQQKDVGNADDIAAIRNNAKTYVDAYNRKDSDAMASLWAKDATVENPLTDESYSGKDAIAAYFKERFQKNKNAKLNLVVDNVEIKGPNKAIVQAHFQLTYDDGSKADGRLEAEYTKESDKWLISDLLQYEEFPKVSHFEYLEKLNWLVGRWTDDDVENLDIDSVWKWDENKNFLTQHFKVTIIGKDDFDGKQIIGWDAVKQKIRSWVFDSDGGTGEGYWIEKGNSWFANMSYTLPDGRQGSRDKHLYKS